MGQQVRQWVWSLALAFGAIALLAGILTNGTPSVQGSPLDQATATPTPHIASIGGAAVICPDTAALLAMTCALGMTNVGPATTQDVNIVGGTAQLSGAVTANQGTPGPAWPVVATVTFPTPLPTATAVAVPAALGQGTMAQSLRVVLPSDQSSVPVTDARLPAFATPVAGMANPSASQILTFPVLYNGATWDPSTNNTEGTLLASAARTSQTSTADQVNYDARGVWLWLSITAASGTGGLTPQLQAKDPVSGSYIQINGSPTARTGTGAVGYVYAPGSPAAGNGVTNAASVPLPRTWRVTIAVGDSSSYTYSLGYSLVH